MPTLLRDPISLYQCNIVPVITCIDLPMPSSSNATKDPINNSLYQNDKGFRINRLFSQICFVQGFPHVYLRMNSDLCF